MITRSRNESSAINAAVKRSESTKESSLITTLQITSRYIGRLSIVGFAILVALYALSTCEAYEFLDKNKWAPGGGAIEPHGGTLNPVMSPGAFTWSVIPPGVGAAPSIPFGEFRGEVTTDIEFLLTSEVDGKELDIIQQALDIWTSAAGVSNLGQVADSGAQIGDTDANGGNIGDLRFAAIELGPGELGRAYAPCVNNSGSCIEGDAIGGDIFISNSDLWVDNPNDGPFDPGFDFFTTVLHEIGHALGLGHTPVDGAVMEGVYAGARRTLQQDDLDGIVALYGVVPEPSTALLAMFSSSLLLVRRRH